MRRIERTVAAVALVCALIQLVPMSRNNPPITQDVAAPAPVAAILRRACYDCHSNQTRWPWYAHLAPVSWMVTRDVDNGRRHLNFSTWNKYADDPETEIRKLRNIDKAIHNDSMPQWYYLPAHSEARLSEADRQVIEDWVVHAIANVGQQGQQK